MKDFRKKYRRYENKKCKRGFLVESTRRNGSYYVKLPEVSSQYLAVDKSKKKAVNDAISLVKKYNWKKKKSKC